ncbi:hypothetical protein MMC30_008383 [Trapelia coarctata]|nr:hypothetical protein [Trapelia coarctata]
MARSKRTFSGQEKTVETPSAMSPFMPMFESFRNELDEHHDRRERIIKASRDITAQSKKIFQDLLSATVITAPLCGGHSKESRADCVDRARQLKTAIPEKVKQENAPRYETINGLFASVAPDMQGINAWRYQRQVSPGVQEYVEAVSFQHYLETQRLITYGEAQGKLPGGVMLTEDDYLLGLFDLVGELMRFAITSMATSGEIPGIRKGNEEGGDMVLDLRSLRAYFEALDTRGAWVHRDVEKKMEVMKTCVEKVENAVYGLIVRGKERPKGWIPEEKGPEPVESY